MWPPVQCLKDSSAFGGHSLLQPSPIHQRSPPFVILPICHPERSEGSLSLCNASAARFNLANESSTPLWSIPAPKCSISQPIHPGGRVKSHPNCKRLDTASTGVDVIVAWSIIPKGRVASSCIWCLSGLTLLTTKVTSHFLPSA